MRSMTKSSFALLLMVVFFAGNAFSSEGKSLFVSLTNDEINRAAMAIKFSTRVRKEQQIPVTIFLNVAGVRIADKNIPSPKHVSGKTQQEMIADFINSGGKVIVCPMCMKNVGGLSRDDLIKGSVVGSSEITMPALFATGTTVLSYQFDPDIR